MTATQQRNKIALKDADYIANMVKLVTGLDIFNNTRKRDHIEARSLFYVILREDYGATYLWIKDYMEGKGKSCDHSTVIHSVNQYEIYKLYSKYLEDWRQMILSRIVQERY
jgi:chromosomal replication initiation ATPase DnaA